MRKRTACTTKNKRAGTTQKERAFPRRESPFQTVKKVKIRRCRRTCADDGDTDREILRQIVCEELCSECAVCRKILSKGFPKRAAEPSAACGGYSEAEQGQRSQSASAVPRRAARCGHRNPSNRSVRRSRTRLLPLLHAHAAPCSGRRPSQFQPLQTSTQAV